jgi:hypothetical protein
MDAFKDHVVFVGADQPLLVLERFGVGFEVHHVAHVLPGTEYLVDGRLRPKVRTVVVRLVGGLVDALA